MKNKILIAVLAMAAFIMASGATAGVIYDESVSGDAVSAGGPAVVGANVGTLAIGDNSIIGTSLFGDFDDYIFQVAANTQLLSISLNLTNGPAQGAVLSDLWTATGTSDVVLSTAGSAFTGVNSLFTDALALGPGLYRIDHNFNYTFDYTWTLTVRPNGQSVPEPGALALFFLGLIGLGVVRRRQLG